MDTKTDTAVVPIDCACVIHSNGYTWDYVDRLYNMVSKNLSHPVRFHVYTEQNRPVPDHMIKHELVEWPGIAGPKRSWWYKMQLFNPALFAGQLLYFDLDVVITGNLDWTINLSKKNFWAIHDFRRLRKPTCRTINSSVMYFDTLQHGYVWDKFQQHSLNLIMSRYKGDQDFITESVDPRHLRYFDLDRVLSWKWQIVEPNKYVKKQFDLENFNEKIPETASVLVFHGNPKPHELNNSVIKKYWN